MTTHPPRATRLLAFARELQRAATFGELLAITRDELAASLGYHHAWIFVGESEDSDEWRLLDSAGAIREEAWKVAPVLKVKGDAMLEEIARSETPVVVEDARTDPRTNKAIVEQLGNRTIINMPLRLLDRPFGAFGTGTFGDEGCRAPTAEQLDYLVGMGSQLSVAASRIRFLAERRRSEDELRKSDARFRRLADSGIIGIVQSDTKGVIHEVNDAFLTMVGYTRDDFCAGKVTAAALNTPEREVTDRGARSQLKNLGFAYPWEKELVRKDGTRVPVMMGVAMVDEATDDSVAFVVDLTERKRAEAVMVVAETMRRAKEAAEAANAELEAFSYSVAHDLRTPLRAINGFSTALLEDYGGKLDSNAHDYLDRILAATERMGHLIDALLGLARLARTEVKREPVDLTHLATSIVAQLRASDAKRQVELVVADRLSTTGDLQLLRALLENLITNAWKFTSTRSMAHIEFGRSDDGAYFVADDGVGFNMDHASKLFSPFRRLHTQEEFEGTGIGLATAERIVRRHGGRIWAEGEEGKGATIRFTLSGEAS